MDVLLSLCKAGPRLENLEVAARFLNQISPYLLESHVQLIAPSPFLPRIEPSPWEALSYQLTSAILAVGVKYPSLHATAYDCTFQYVQNCLKAIKAKVTLHYDSDDLDDGVGFDEILEIASISASLLGFLEAASLYTQFYYISERLGLVTVLRLVMSEGFMVSVEGAFSSIRTCNGTSNKFSKELLMWKTFTKRYAASGRPLGAMVLQRAFMRFLVSCSALQIATPEQLQATDILDLLTSEAELVFNETDDTSAALLEELSDIAKEEIRLLEDGADYLQLGSAWQQRLAFAVKAYALTTFLNCMIFDEDTADTETLMSWLEDTIADPTQMADVNLACTVLKSMAVAAKFSSSVASSLSRSLPRFIVQGGIQGEVTIVAARSLTSVLQLVSQDAVITCLYSMGNVLSARSRSEKLKEDALSILPSPGKFSHHSGASAISLVLNGEEETALVYGNIVQAIVSVAVHCKDENITALSLSMLLQKLGRVSLALDLHIITEAARLVACSGPAELKSLLKLYSKVSHNAIVQGNDTLLEAVSIRTSSYKIRTLL
jgi:phosphatidylinositol 4-kinase A